VSGKNGKKGVREKGCQVPFFQVPFFHSEPFACHSERSEESRSAAQGKLREEPLLNDVKESRSAAQVNSARNLTLVFLGRSARRRARFLAPLGMTFHSFWAFVGCRT